MLKFVLKVVFALLCCAGSGFAQSVDELVRDAESKLRAKDAAAALQLAEAAVKQSPERWDGHFVRAIALLSLGRASDALASAEAAAVRAPADRKEAVQKLIDRCKPSDGTQRAALLVREAEAAMKEGLDDLAARKFAGAFELDNSQAQAGLKAAGLWVALEQYSAAGKMLKPLRDSADEAVRKKATELTEKIRVVVAEPLRAHLEAARAALDSERLDLAKAELAKAEALFDDGEGHFLSAKLAVRERRLVEALQHLKAAKVARAVGVEVVRQDADMAVLAKDAGAAEWMRNAFGTKVVDALLAMTVEAPARESIATGIGLRMLYVKADPNFTLLENQQRAPVPRGIWLAETEVTQGQWRAVMGATPWQGNFGVKEGVDVAVNYVSWNDAQEFCRKLTERERGAGRLPAGHAYRLPKEAEWELACRAGTSTVYSFGDSGSELGQYAVFAGSREGEFAHRVKNRKPNGWGFYDMHGNVWEWCEDAFSGSRRVCRGGGWNDSAGGCRSARRDGDGPGGRSDLGFRPALAASSDK
jgi:tetratricopeptide (TPR) repeat protein